MVSEMLEVGGQEGYKRSLYRTHAAFQAVQLYFTATMTASDLKACMYLMQHLTFFLLFFLHVQYLI